MSNPRRVATLLALFFAAVFAARPFAARATSAPPASSDTVVLTVTAIGKKDSPPPAIKPDDVQFMLGNEKKQIAGWTKADKLGLAVLIDDSLNSSAASQWGDLKNFLTAQPDTTSELIAYARDGVAMVAQDFTNDHDAAAKALRIPLSSVGAYGSIYLSLLDLMKRWPASRDRRSILLITSGIDYFRGGFGPTSPDLDPSVQNAEKGNINVWSIYYPGMAHRSRSYFRSQYGQWNLSELADETGAESYYLGFGVPVTFKPWLDEIQNHLGNQYLLAFNAGAAGGKKGKFERVRLKTELDGVEFMNANQVFLPPAQ
jgi:hypothetical protein